MDPLDLVKLTALMERTRGNPEVKIGLIDGPVLLPRMLILPANTPVRFREITAPRARRMGLPINSGCISYAFRFPCRPQSKESLIRE